MNCFRTLSFALAIVCTVASIGHAELLNDSQYKFTLTVPDGFTADPQLAKASDSFLYAFRKNGGDAIGTVVIIERLHGTIGPERLDISSMPAGFKGKLVDLRWHGFTVQAIEVPEQSGGNAVVNFNVQVPLKLEAIQVRVLGSQARETELLELTKTLLDSLQGESNWPGPAGSTAKAATTVPAAPISLQANPLTDPKTGIQLRLPNAWVSMKGIQDTGFEAPTKDRVDTGGLAPSIVLGKDAAPGINPADVEAIIAAKQKQYAKIFPTCQAEPAGGVKPAVVGYGVGRIDGTYLAENVLPIHLTQIWIVGRGTIYTITCSSLRNTSAVNSQTFDAIFKTVSVTGN